MIYGYSTYLNNCSRILTFQRPTIFCSWQYREDSFNRVRFKPGTFGVLFFKRPDTFDLQSSGAYRLNFWETRPDAHVRRGARRR
jgi:hypothetical protein